jgi:hypothetical protein
LLEDPESKIIRAYGVFNAEATGMQKGFARPGYFFIDANGIIREKFFEAKYRERLTGNSIISKLFPELGEEVVDTVEAPHLQLALEQSDRTGVPGTRVTLAAEVRLPADVHVYAPGTQGYKPIKLVIDDTKEIELKPAVYPQSKILYLPAIKEKVPVYEGTFRISQDAKVSSTSEFWGSLGKDGKILTITGKLGEVMQESTRAALTWVRANAERYGIDPDFFRKQDIHIHVPSGGIPKDGPSAGIAMVTALVSLLTGKPVRPRVAMTGEISLSGIVLPVGGIKEKVLGAKRAGIREVILPSENEPNLKEDLQPHMLEGMQVHFVRTADQALEIALGRIDRTVQPPTGGPHGEKRPGAIPVH